MTETKKSKLHYAWVIVIVSTLMAVVIGLLCGAFSVCYAALREYHGLNETQTATLLTARNLSCFVATLFIGPYYKKLGIRMGMFIASLGAVISFFLYSIGNGNMLIYTIAGAVAGIPYGLAFVAPPSMLMKNWFNRQRGFALSIAMAGTGISLTIGSPIMQILIETFSLETNFVCLGCFSLFVSILIFLLIKDSPEAMGLEPYGGKDFVDVNAKVRSGKGSGVSAMACAMMLISSALTGAVASTSTAYLSLTFTDVGIAAMAAAKALSVFGITVIASKLLFGIATDKFGSFKVSLVFGLMLTAGCSFTFGIIKVPEIWWMYVSVMLIGLGSGFQTLSYPNWAAELCTSVEYPGMIAKLQLAHQIGTLAFSIIPGFIAKAMGYYAGVYLVIGILSLFATACGVIALYNKKN